MVDRNHQWCYTWQSGVEGHLISVICMNDACLHNLEWEFRCGCQPLTLSGLFATASHWWHLAEIIGGGWGRFWAQVTWHHLVWKTLVSSDGKPGCLQLVHYSQHSALMSTDVNEAIWLSYSLLLVHRCLSLWSVNVRQWLWSTPGRWNSRRLKDRLARRVSTNSCCKIISLFFVINIKHKILLFITTSDTMLANKF